MSGFEGEVTVSGTVNTSSVAVVGQKTMANSTPVVMASDQSAIPVSISSPLGVQTPSNSVSTLTALSTLFGTGQLAVTASALALGASTSFKNGFALANLSSSTASLFVGGSGVTTSTGYEIAPGTSLVIPVQDISTVYVVAAVISTATACWIGFD